jgi:hypothetical protein
MACQLRRREDLRDEQLWGPFPALETELGVELVVFEHSAGETQPICGLRPKNGTAPRRRHCLKHMCRPRIQRSRVGRGTALYLAIRSAHL